jgi:hypothetical protein
MYLCFNFIQNSMINYLQVKGRVDFSYMNFIKDLMKIS